MLMKNLFFTEGMIKSKTSESHKMNYKKSNTDHASLAFSRRVTISIIQSQYNHKPVGNTF